MWRPCAARKGTKAVGRDSQLAVLGPHAGVTLMLYSSWGDRHSALNRLQTGEKHWKLQPCWGGHYAHDQAQAVVAGAARRSVCATDVSRCAANAAWHCAHRSCWLKCVRQRNSRSSGSDNRPIASSPSAGWAAWFQERASMIMIWPGSDRTGESNVSGGEVSLMAARAGPAGAAAMAAAVLQVLCIRCITFKARKESFVHVCSFYEE